MWGSSFADLAKKAQALQEQASSLSAGELFNLDAMQSDGGATRKETNAAHQPHDPSTAQLHTPAPNQQHQSFPLPPIVDPSNTNVKVAAFPKATTPQPKGKLKIQKPSFKPKTVTASGGLVINKEKSNTAPKGPTTSSFEAPTTVLKISNSEKSPPSAVDSKATAYEKSEADLEQDQNQPSVPIPAEPTSTRKGNKDVDKKDMRPVQDPPDDLAFTTKMEQVTPEDVQKNGDGAKEARTPKEEDEILGDVAHNDDKKKEIAEQGNMKEADGPKHPEQNAEGTVGNSLKVGAPMGNQFYHDNKPESDDQADQVAKSKERQVDKKIENQQDEINNGPPVLGLDKQKEDSPKKMNPTTEPVARPSEAVLAEIQVPTEEENANDKLDGKSLSKHDLQKQTPNSIVDSRNQAPKDPTSPQNSVPKCVPIPMAQKESDNAVSDRVMEQFTAQLQRLEANFDAERKEMRKQHSHNITNAIAAKEREMEEVMAKMKEKDTKLRELRRIKEGNELRMDSLKREVDGIKELLEERGAEIDKLKQLGNQDKHQLEKIVRAEESAHAKTKKELKEIKDELKNSKGALGATNDEFTALRSKVKVVAGELKERRAECRELKTKIDELEQLKETNDDYISNLESQLSDRDRSGSEKDEEVSTLRSSIEGLEQKLKEARKDAKVQEESFEKNLATYKKKAQNALAVANSRAAAATQAKEEAELEARAARSTADATMERARVAEENGQKAMREAKEFYKEMEAARENAVGEFEASEVELNKVKKTLSDAQAKLELSAAEKASLAADKAQMARDCETERTKSGGLQRDLEASQRRVSSLERDSADLRSRLQAAEAAAEANARNGKGRWQDSASENAATTQTIIMLQQQLKEANNSIKELKEALENAIVMGETSTNAPGAAAEQVGSSSTSVTDGSSPLFYAMEKQAELNTARNEINRLASLYADVQSHKNEAEEALQLALKELAEEKAKLQRYEKLRGADPAAPDDKGTTNGQGANEVDPGRTNIEYLKNVMLSFLNAKTLTEKKSLVPVIGAVLCLTPDEQANAIYNVEATAGIEGFGSALFGTIGNFR